MNPFILVNDVENAEEKLPRSAPSTDTRDMVRDYSHFGNNVAACMRFGRFLLSFQT